MQDLSSLHSEDESLYGWVSALPLGEFLLASHIVKIFIIFLRLWTWL